MKWSADINFDIYKGRKRIFSLKKLIPFIGNWRKIYKNRYRSCLGKTRYKSDYEAMNAAWFKKHPDIRHAAYLCPVCDGWHITTRCLNEDGSLRLISD
jgi:hypothetical protein